MFKKGPDIDKKKLLQKASDVKKDSLTRLKHFKTLIEHLEFNELPFLFKSHFSFIYHTFIDTFSTFDCNSKQRRDDLDCILFMLEKILIFNPELIKKRWQFYSITFVMQKMLHRNNTWRLRLEGVRLFIIWYQILCDETNVELQTIFASIVPRLIPQRTNQLQPSLASPTPSSSSLISPQQQQQHQSQNHSSPSPAAGATNSPSSQPQQQQTIKLCSIDPLVPMSANEQLPSDETYFYLDNLLQFMVTQTTKPYWKTPEEARKNQELSFSFIFNMFKKVYLQPLFPNFDLNIINPLSKKTNLSNYQYVDGIDDTCHLLSQNNNDEYKEANHSTPLKSKKDPLRIDLKQQASPYLSATGALLPTSNTAEHDRMMALSVYQSIVIRWLTRIMRQDMIPGQDELIKAGNSSERREFQGIHKEASSGQDHEFSHGSDGNSTTMFQNMETTSREMEIARKVAGTRPENIAVLHELFRRAFLNYFQPASMKRVVNVYKEWICNGGPNQTNLRLGYTSFGDLLQVFVLNSSNAFLAKVHNPTLLDEQVEMCKRIMNIYRYMVMKIYMNTSTWEQLLNVMLSITEQLFPVIPPEKRETIIGGRIAPAFFQTFIVSWIRANLYVHISTQMWNEFHRVMKNLVRWRELIEEWSTTMGSLTRVLVKHVYGLSLADLPLDKPQERRRRAKNMKSFSTVEPVPNKSANNQDSPTAAGPKGKSHITSDQGSKTPRSGSVRLAGINMYGIKGLVRSNSDGILLQSSARLYFSSLKSDKSPVGGRHLRKIKSQYILSEAGFDFSTGAVSNSHTDVIDGASLKDPNMIIDNDQVIESHHSSNKPSLDDTAKSSKKSADQKANTDKCVLLGGNVRGWTPENSVIMWRRMLGLFGNINQIEDPDSHLVALRCLAVILSDFLKTRENLGISIDNQITPELPKLIPPYTYQIGWLLEATHLPRQFKESRLTAYSLICLMSIRRHDIELPQQYYAAFYEALHRGLTGSDPFVHASIIKNSTQLLSLELPGCTFLAQDLYERARSILLSPSKEIPIAASPREQAIQILSSILALHKPIKKLMVLKPEINNQMNLVAPGDIKTKIFDTFLACNLSPVVLDSQTRSRCLCSIAMHVYQELCDKGCDSLDVEKLFDTLLTDLQDMNNSNLFRINCDLLSLFADHGQSLAQSRPALVSSVIQIVCQLIVRLSTIEENKEFINCLLLCLELWCIAVGKNYLLKPVGQLSTDDDTLSTSLNESLVTIVLRSLENVIYDEQYVDDLSNKGTRGSTTTSKTNSDAHSTSRVSQTGSNPGDTGFIGPRQRAMTNELGGNHHNRSNPNDSPVIARAHGTTAESKEVKAMKLACRVSHLKLVTYLGHFPFRQVGAASLSCCVNEADYLADEGEISDFEKVSGLTLLVVDESTIISFIGEPNKLDGPASSVHLIVRNLCGKYSWDASCIDSNFNYQQQQLHRQSCDQDRDSIVIDADSFQQDDSRSSMKFDSITDFNDDGNSSSSLSSRSSGNRDFIGDLLNQLSSFSVNNGGGSPAAIPNVYKKRNCALSTSNPNYKIAQAEETMVALLTNQRFQELNYCERSDDLDRVVLNLGPPPTSGKSSMTKPSYHDTNSSTPDFTNQEERLSQLNFEQCKTLIQQLGLLTWEKRPKVDSLAKSARLLRELKNLDSQLCRETHKIAVIYVANGQEDKNSILMNSTGSRAFEDFVSGLGWEVNLASHLGFRGGLQANKSTGETSPYYCNSITEIMFHVSTRIPISGPADDEALNRKLRHLGNDEIHIVWSEHTRDYRRGIIPTEFGDVIIAIYPMLTFQGYYRIQISSKPDVPMFGPLFDNCIVHQSSLASLVRATAVNASRAKRLKLPYYQSHFEERSRLIETIVQNHKEKLSFEDFAIQLYQTNKTPPSVISASQSGNNNSNSSSSNQAPDASCCA